MKQKTVWLLLFIGFMGIAIGFFAGRGFTVNQKVVPSDVLGELSFSKIISKVHSSEWEIIEDRVYDTLPPLSRSPRIARRIVAQSPLPDAEQTEFTSRFQAAAEEWITSCGATIKGQEDAQRTSVEATTDGTVRTLFDLPRRYYAVGDVHGVADFGCIARKDSAIVIISIIEGP